MTTKAITAPRHVRALYYAGEYGTRAAVRLLSAESRGLDVVRVPSGTAGTCGLFRTIKQANEWRLRVVALAAHSAGRIGAGCPGVVMVEVEAATKDQFARYAAIKPMAS